MPTRRTRTSKKYPTSSRNPCLKSLLYITPLAGRTRDRLTIDCNDEGVLFLVARIKWTLPELLQNPKDDVIDSLFADNLQWKITPRNSFLLAIQINFFDNGGMAISVCMSHTFGDGFTLINLIKGWSDMNKIQNNNNSTSTHDAQILPLMPLLNAASIFPQGDLPYFPEYPEQKNIEKIVCKRYVFDASKINILKSAVGKKLQTNPTRVQVVAVLLYKCVVSALRLSNKSNSLMKATLVQTVNLRTRRVPPLPTNSIGNESLMYVTSTTENAELNLHDLVSKIKESPRKFCDTYTKNLNGEQWFTLYMQYLEEMKVLHLNENQVFYLCTSLCRFGLYEVNFGWGEPTWMTFSNTAVKNMILLMDTRDGDGIEAIVALEEQEMAVFEHDEDLLAHSWSRTTNV
ncbi:Vinorine synthase [Quillaja saponaria]|uniref:Vinorine synthase n=1 Tax=Quillaja saponaria TaxID=32244 RepID=A0AAD7LAT1_QUISA|nr:Vinorine synthase [Quillaja saponaria]